MARIKRQVIPNNSWGGDRQPYGPLHLYGSAYRFVLFLRDNEVHSLKRMNLQQVVEDLGDFFELQCPNDNLVVVFRQARTTHKKWPPHKIQIWTKDKPACSIENFWLHKVGSSYTLYANVVLYDIDEQAAIDIITKFPKQWCKKWIPTRCRVHEPRINRVKDQHRQLIIFRNVAYRDLKTLFVLLSLHEIQWT